MYTVFKETHIPKYHYVSIVWFMASIYQCLVYYVYKTSRNTKLVHSSISNLFIIIRWTDFLSISCVVEVRVLCSWNPLIQPNVCWVDSCMTGGSVGSVIVDALTDTLMTAHPETLHYGMIDTLNNHTSYTQCTDEAYAIYIGFYAIYIYNPDILWGTHKMSGLYRYCISPNINKIFYLLLEVVFKIFNDCMHDVPGSLTIMWSCG